MKKFFAITLIIQMMFITMPVEAGRDNLYTAVTEINLVKIEQVVPYTLYWISYEYEIWSERDADLRPETLNIDADKCLLNLTISTTSDIESRSYCILVSRPPTDEYDVKTFRGGITDTHSKSTVSLYRMGLHLTETDYNATSFPDGGISFNFGVVEPAVSNIFGDMYGSNITTENKTNSIIYDDIPDNYGQVSEREENYLHFRFINVEPSKIKPYNYTGTSFSFDVKSEILNAGTTFSQTFSTTITEYLDAEGVVDGKAFNLSKPMGGDMMKGKSYPANRRVQYDGHLYIHVPDQLIDSLPDSDIMLWFSTDQLEDNTYYAYITCNEGSLSIDYDTLPDFWFDYPLYDEHGNEIPIPWYSLSMLILIPVALISRKKRTRLL